MVNEKDAEEKIFSTFAALASSLGYSPLHGKIIGVLLVKEKPLSLQELAKATGYSSSMISLSLDLLEVLGVVKRVKLTGDRKLYVELHGDLLECLKKVVLIRVEKAISDSLSEFEKSKKQLEKMKSVEKKRVLRTLDILEKQIRRLEKYVNLLSKIKLP